MKKTAATPSRQATAGPKDLVQVAEKTKKVLRSMIGRLDQLIQHPSDEWSGVFLAVMPLVETARDVRLITKREMRAIATELKAVIKRVF